MNRKLVTVLVLAVILFAACLRFHNLETQSLWNDEGNAYVQATRSLADIAANAARDIHPPGYYWLLAIWRGLAGDGEFALRALSALAGVLTVAFTYALGRRLLGVFAGLTAALFVALNTFQVYYAQEARMYALLALWSAAGLWALARLLSQQSLVFRRQSLVLKTRYSILSTILPLALVNAVGLYTHYAYPFVMVAQGVIVLVWVASAALTPRPPLPQGEGEMSARQGTSKPPSDTGNRQPATGNLLIAFILANLLALALFLPWLPTAWAQVTGWPSTGEATETGAALQTILGWLAYGITFEATGPATLPYVPIFLAVGLVPFGAARPRWGRILFPVITLVVVVGLFLALGLFREANLKFLLPAQIAFALWMGRAAGVMWWAARVGARPSMLLSAAVAASLGVILVDVGRGLAPLYDDSAFQRADYRALAALVEADARPGDAIILDAPNQEEVFRYYYWGEMPVYPLPRGLGGDDAATRAEVRRIIADSQRIFAVFWGEAERDPNRVVESTLDAETFEAGENVWYGDVRLARYVMPAGLPEPTPSGARFGEAITLEAYALGGTAQPGDVLQVRLDWQTAAPLDRRYKVFVQLLDADGVLAAQRDSEPGGGSALTINWPPGTTITDHHGLLLPDLTPGEYTLIVGLYDLDDPSARLPVGDGDYL
ncbi:MAG: glycosyltransferase family 39 protein, partial [Chloroflexi bacterium]|nr:glycosyltransferase family 39 protein [Chloroflexota bacterium]